MELITQGGKYGNIDLTGKGAYRNDDRDILLIINAPGETVEIDCFKGRDCWLPLWIRNVGKLVINDYQADAFMNDGLHIRSSHVHIKKARIFSDIKKVYGPKNHPDNIQIFTDKPGGRIGNIQIDRLTMYNRNTPEHMGVHLTERDYYHDIYIGADGLIYDSDATTPYWFSANTLENAIIGHPDMFVSDKGIRILDVKDSGKPIDGVYLIGMNRELIKCAPGYIDSRIHLNQFSRAELKAVADLTR
jgi:hypothetical protein